MKETESNIRDLVRLYETEKKIGQNLFLISLLKHRIINLKEILEKQELFPIAVYGLGKIGYPFAKWLIETGVNIVYCYDKNIDIKFENVEIRHSMYDCEDVKTIIVTTDYVYNDMKKNMKRFEGIRIIRLHDLLEGLMLIPEPVYY